MFITSNHQTMLPRCTASIMFTTNNAIAAVLHSCISPVLLACQFLSVWVSSLLESERVLFCFLYDDNLCTVSVLALSPGTQHRPAFSGSGQNLLGTHCRGDAIQQALVPIWTCHRRVPALLGVVLSLPAEWTLHKQHMCTWLSITVPVKTIRGKAPEFPSSILGPGFQDCGSYICLQREVGGRGPRVHVSLLFSGHLRCESPPLWGLC